MVIDLLMVQAQEFEGRQLSDIHTQIISHPKVIIIVGSFPMTELEEECVLAMKVDSGEEHLVAGDSAGFIAVFNIKTYCTSAEV